MSENNIPKPGEFIHTKSEKLVFINVYSPMSGVSEEKDQIPPESLEDGKGLGIKHSSSHAHTYISGKVTKIDLENRIFHIVDPVWGLTVSLKIGVNESEVSISPAVKLGETVKVGDNLCDIEKSTRGEIMSAILILNDSILADKDVKIFYITGEQVEEAALLMSVVSKENK